MKKSLVVFCVGLMILNCSVLFAQVVEKKDVISPEVYDTVVKNGNYKLIHETGDNDYVLLPNCAFKNDCESNRVVKKNKYYPFVAEMIYEITKSDLKKTSGSPKGTFNISDVSKVFRSVSKMEGMTYYSSTRKKRMVLYKDAYMIESEDNPIRIEDLIYGNANGKVCFAYLDDASFGPCKYRLVYNENENSLYARFTNLDIMGLGPFKAVYPGDLILNIIVLDCGESFLMYLGVDVDCVKFPGIKSQLEDSLVSRLDAIYDWFKKQF